MQIIITRAKQEWPEYKTRHTRLRRLNTAEAEPVMPDPAQMQEAAEEQVEAAEEMEEENPPEDDPLEEVLEPTQVEDTGGQDSVQILETPPDPLPLGDLAQEEKGKDKGGRRKATAAKTRATPPKNNPAASSKAKASPKRKARSSPKARAKATPKAEAKAKAKATAKAKASPKRTRARTCTPGLVSSLLLRRSGTAGGASLPHHFHGRSGSFLL